MKFFFIGNYFNLLTYYLNFRRFTIFLISWKHNGNRNASIYYWAIGGNLLLLFSIKQIFDELQRRLESFDKGFLIFIARMIRICIHCDGNRISLKHVM